MKPAEIKDAKAFTDTKEKNITSLQDTVKITLREASETLSKQEAALLSHYGLLFYNFCS
jgi:hypothetical protein